MANGFSAIIRKEFKKQLHALKKILVPKLKLYFFFISLLSLTVLNNTLCEFFPNLFGIDVFDIINFFIYHTNETILDIAENYVDEYSGLLYIDEDLHDLVVFFFFLCISALILSVTCFVVILFIVIVLFFFMFCNQFIVQLQPFLSEQRDSVNVSSLNNSFLSLGKRYFIIKELQLILKNFKNFIICSFGEIWDVCLSQAFFMSFFYSHSFNLFLFLIFFFMAFVFLMNYFEEIFVELNKINKTPTEVVIPIGSAIDVSGVLDNLPNLKKMLHDFETCKSAPKFVNTLFRLIHYFFSVFLYVYFLVTFYIIVLNILYFLHNYSFIFLSNPYLTNLWVFLFWALAPIFFIFSLKLLMLRLKKRGFSSVQIFKILVIVLSLIALFTLIGLFVILFI